MEFSTTSQPASAEKPANLVLNGSSSFVDNIGNPHITGSIINQGQSPEQFLNLVATFYDNSSIGVIGTQTSGLNVGNLAHNQMAPFDITITDNKTKSKGAFYSLNVDSSQSSMSIPLNTKTSFASTDGFATSGGDSLANTFSVNDQSQFSNNDNDDDESRSSDDDDDDDRDNQRGEKKTDDEGNPWFDDENCNEESGSSGGSSSECEEAEREEESEREDEDSLEKDQGPPSNSESTGNNNDESNDEGKDDNE